MTQRGAVEWLNCHHLLHFWTVAREGGISKAAEKVRLSQPTISAQVRALEESLGERLFQRQNRTLVLTDTGRLVYRYADEIFGIGRELMKHCANGQWGARCSSTSASPMLSQN